MAAAATEAGCYAGKSIALLVGFRPGGGSDLYARTLARHIPGNPQAHPTEHAGAGSLKAVNYLFNVEVSAPPTGGRKARD